MLIRLPIIILTSLHPTLIADAVPKIDIARECQFKSGSEEDPNRCADDETRINPKLPTKGLSVDPAVFLFWAAGMGWSMIEDTTRHASPGSMPFSIRSSVASRPLLALDGVLRGRETIE
jgi:hypothetical protein